MSDKHQRTENKPVKELISQIQSAIQNEEDAAYVILRCAQKYKFDLDDLIAKIRGV
jgi:hypothetical protein